MRTTGKRLPPFWCPGANKECSLPKQAPHGIQPDSLSWPSEPPIGQPREIVLARGGRPGSDLSSIFDLDLPQHLLIVSWS